MDKIMAKTATVAVRVDPRVKRSVERIFHRLGLSSSQAISLFYAQVSLRGGLPFEVRVPTRETRTALDEASSPERLPVYGSIDDLLKLGGQDGRKKTQGHKTISKGSEAHAPARRRPRPPTRGA